MPFLTSKDLCMKRHRKWIYDVTPPGEFVRAKERVLILFSALLISTFSPYEDLNAEVRQTAISTTSGGRSAWAIGLETGFAAITEIWVETSGRPPRHLGTFPGQPGPLEWVARGKRLHYRETPLRVPLHTLTMLPKRSVPLVPSTVWEISVRDGSIVRSKEKVKGKPASPFRRAGVSAARPRNWAAPPLR